MLGVIRKEIVVFIRIIIGSYQVDGVGCVAAARLRRCQKLA